MIPERMAAVQLIGHGGIEKLKYREDIPVPSPGKNELLIKVTATAKNNTDRKVREGLYPTEDNRDVTSFSMSKDSGLSFPRIQGADVVGRVVKCGSGVAENRLGERGLLDFNIYSTDRDDINLTPDYFGHGKDGGFAEYMVVPADQFYTVENTELSDAELAAMGMCSYQTGLHMLNAAGVSEGENVLITGASGGVGTALIQMCRIKGATPYAVSSPGKAKALFELGAENIIDRSKVTDWPEAVKKATDGKIIDAVMDLVGGDMTIPLIDSMIQDMSSRQTYPRYSIAGASGGNVTKILWTKIYLYQVQIFGISHGTRAEAKQLINWIRNGKLRPVLHGTFKLSDIHKAENYFVNRSSNFVGKIVIVPDSEWEVHGKKYAISGE